MDWDHGTSPQIAAKILGLDNLLLEEIESAETKWIQESKEIGFGKDPLTGCIEEHFEEKRREVQRYLNSLEMGYLRIESDTKGLIAEDFWDQLTIPKIDDLDIAVKELRKAFLKSQHDHTPEWSGPKFHSQQRILSAVLVDRFNFPQDYGKVFDGVFERAYRHQKVTEFIPQLINACVSNHGIGATHRNERCAADLASLANNAWGVESIGNFSVESGIKDVHEGAKKWLDDLKGKPSTLIDVVQVEGHSLFNLLLSDIAKDKEAANYERLYICVKFLATKELEEEDVVAIGYFRGIMHLLIWEDLDEERAIFVVRTLKLLSLIEHADFHKQKLKQDIQSAIPSIAKWVDRDISFRLELFNVWNEDKENEWINEGLRRCREHNIDQAWSRGMRLESDANGKFILNVE